MSNLLNSLLGEKTDLMIEKVVEDVRGKNTFLSFEDLELILVETNKGFSRGGHYHKSNTNHTLISGSIHLIQKSILNGYESEKTFVAPATIPISANYAHMLTAITDTKLIEAFPNGYEDTVYPEYRELVERRMKK